MDNNFNYDNNTLLTRLCLFSFYLVLIFVVFILGYSFFNHNSLKSEKRVYSMKLSEKLSLDDIYHSNNIKWYTDSENVSINDNIVSPKKTGVAYLYAKKNNKLVSDLTIHVLKNEETSDNNKNISSKSDVSKISKDTNKDNSFNKLLNFFKNFFNSFFTHSNSKDLNKKDGTVIEENKLDILDDKSLDSNDDSYNNNDNDSKIVTNDSGTVSGKEKEIVEDVENQTIKDDLDDIILDNSRFRLKKGKSIKVNYSIVGNNYDINDLIWSSDNSKICSVTDDGVITAINDGKTVVRVSLGNISKTINVIVYEDIILPKDIKVSVEKLEVEVGSFKEVDASIIPSNTTYPKLVWVSSDTNVATVKDGRIIGINEGEAIVAIITKNNIRRYINVKVVNKNTLPNNSETKVINWYIKAGSIKKIDYNSILNDNLDKIVKIDYDKDYLFIDNDYNVKSLKPGITSVYLETSEGRRINLNINISNVTVKLKKIMINERSIDLKVNENKKLNLTYLPSNATDTDVSWFSSNSKIVAIDNNGNIKGLNEGKATLYVVSNNNSKIFDTVLVNVKKQDNTNSIPSIILNSNDMNLSVGESKKLIAAVNQLNSNNIIKWKSSNDKVVTVDNEGNIKGVSNGTATISAYLIDKDGYVVDANIKDATCKVTVSVIETDIRLNYTSTTIEVGKSLNLVATINPTNATNKNVTWTSSNNNIATVDSNGIVTAKSAGNVTITASTVNKKTAFVNINVKSIPIVKPNNTPAPKVLKNGFIKSNNYTYYYVNDKMVTGLKKIGNYNYYFDNNGRMVTGIKKIGNYNYYFDNNGRMVSGLKKINNDYYYFENNGIMISGWKKVNGINMYFKTNGKRASGKEKINNGKYQDTYWFNEKTGKVEGHVLGITYIHQMYGVWDPNKKDYSKKDYNPNTKNFLNNKPIGGTACGITSCSMAITSLRGKLTSPTVFNSPKYGFNGKGSNYNVAVLTAKKYNLKGKVYNVLSKNEIKAHIDKGHFIVVGVKGSIYGGGGDTKGGNSRTTGGGHFILIHGYKGDSFAIADPNNVSQTYVRSGKLNTYESFANHQGRHPGGTDFRQYGVIYK